MERRKFFRIDYPPLDRPSFLAGGRTYAVVNLSETGLEYEESGLQPPIGKPVYGTVVFSDHERAEVEGAVVRSTGAGVCVQLTHGIPFRKVLAEQRRLLAKYKTLKKGAA